MGPDESPLGEWSVVRERTGGRGGEGGSVGRKLTITASQLVERRADTYEVLPLSSNNTPLILLILSSDYYNCNLIILLI